jgi:hypothetical protein
MLSWNAASEIRTGSNLLQHSRKVNMKITRRITAGAAALALPALMLASSPAVANSSEAAQSGSWLAGELNSGLLVGAWGPDRGLSADALMTLEVLNVESSAANAIGDALAADPQAYISGEAFGDTGSTYAGATGKLTTVLALNGRGITNVSGVNLVERLESVIVTEGPETGRGKDVSTWGDYSNGVGQAWVTRGLSIADSELADEAANYLLGKQCADGGFPVNLNAETCTSGHDATAYAIAAIIEARSSGALNTTTANSAINSAAASLKNAQNADGSLGADDGINSNSTGLSSWALRLSGETAAADKAVTWLRTVYAKSGSALNTEAGAIAFNPAAFTAATTGGVIDGASREQWTRATAQAAIAWAGASDPEPEPEPEPTPEVAAPGTVVAGANFNITGSGFAPGESVLIDLSLDGSGGGMSAGAFKFATLATVTANGSGAVAHAAVAPSVPGNYTLSLIAESGTAATPIVVTAPPAGPETDTDTEAADDDAEAADELDRTDGTASSGVIAAGAVLALIGGALALVAVRRRTI